jgi:hypothetical protein
MLSSWVGSIFLATLFHISAFADTCENVVYSPSYEKIVLNFTETLSLINKGQSCLEYPRECEPNTTGTCYANAAIDVYASYDYATHPIYAALLFTKKYKDKKQHERFSSGYACDTVMLLKDEATVCDHVKFNEYFGLKGADSLDKILDSFKLPTVITKDALLISIIKSMLGIQEIKLPDPYIEMFNETLSNTGARKPFDEKKFSELIQGEDQGAKTKMLNLIWKKEYWSILNLELDKLIKEKGQKTTLADFQFSFMKQLCNLSGAQQPNPLFKMSLDYESNYIGDETSESSILQEYIDQKKLTPAGQRYPDFITIFLDRFLNPASTDEGRHAFIALGQRWDPITGRCQLVMKDSNPHYTDHDCKGNKERGLVTIYDKKTLSCYYYFPKFDLLNPPNKQNKYIDEYCYVGTEKNILSILKGRHEKSISMPSKEPN